MHAGLASVFKEMKTLLLLATAAAVLMPCSVAAAGGQCIISAAEVAEAAMQVCGGAPIEEALQSVQLRPAPAVSQMLTKLGFQSALDLHLLAGGPEATELLGELKAGGLSIGDRAKVRLLN